MKLIIPEHLLSKISYINSQINSVEWMGVFIYETSGTFPKDNFTIKGVDIHLMSKGTQAEVGYVADISLIKELCEVGLDEYNKGLIHSHNSMATGFSGTDTQQLQLSAGNLPYYLSVVVNNKLEVTAKIAIKSVEKYTGYSYFKDLKNKLIRTPKVLESESFEIIQLEVERRFPAYILSVNERIAKMQLYTTEYNSRSNRGQFKAKEYSTSTNKVVTGTKSLLGVALQEDSLTAGFLKEVIDFYCTDMSHNPLPAAECVRNIIQDGQNYGIPLSEYKDYFLQKNVFDRKTDNEILKLLHSPQTQFNYE